jgi:UDP:flavonoid glycosyltransferase YjiC (YdhE family)
MGGLSMGPPIFVCGGADVVSNASRPALQACICETPMKKELNVVVVALGSAGDVHPMVGLALTLRRRGHGVLLVGPMVFKPLAERVGLEFAGLGTEEEFYESIRDPDLWHPIRAFPLVAKKLILPAMRPVYELIATRRERDPGRTVVTAPSTAFGARIAQEKLGVALATIHLQPSMLRSNVDPPCYSLPDILGALPQWLRPYYWRAVDRLLIDPLLVPEVNAFRRELGLGPARRFFGDWMHSPQRAVGFFPGWFAPPAPDWPPQVRLAGFPLWDESEVREPSAELAQFLDEGEPPVVFTAGSAMAQGEEFFRVSAEVCRASGWRGLLLTQFPEQLPNSLPVGVRHFHYVPFSAVLPRAAAFVHHGGIGTTAQALAAGVPQLVTPLAHDQPDNATRVKRLGVGDFLPIKRYKMARVRERLARLMKSATVKENCRRYAQELTGRTALEQTCALVEELGGRARP